MVNKLKNILLTNMICSLFLAFLKKMNYKLSTEDLSDIPFDKYEKYFRFVVNGQEIYTNRLFADFLSPLIRRSHYFDSSLDTFSIEINNNNNNDHNNEKVHKYFEEFLQLPRFDCASINEEQRAYFSLFFCELGNFKEYLKLCPEMTQEMNTENALHLLFKISDMSKKHREVIDFLSDTYDKVIGFIASHFYLIDKKSLQKASRSDIERIVSDRRLKIESEDELFEFIQALYEEDESESRLFDYVAFKHLSDKSLSKFFSTFNHDHVDAAIWCSIAGILSQFIKIIHFEILLIFRAHRISDQEVRFRRFV